LLQVEKEDLVVWEHLGMQLPLYNKVFIFGDKKFDLKNLRKLKIYKILVQFPLEKKSLKLPLW
jgi:hypothetical protein